MLRWFRPKAPDVPHARPRRIPLSAEPGVRLDEIAGAIVHPVTHLKSPRQDPDTHQLIKGHFDGGVYGADGVLWPSGASAYLNHTNTAPAQVATQNVRRLKGRYLYVGLVQNQHFGHFLTENTTRLWALHHAGSVDGILYLGRYPNQPLASYIKDLFNIFAPGVPLVAVTRPTQVDRLVVPQTLAFPQGALYGHPLNRTFFDASISALPPSRSEMPKHLFVSRSRLAKGAAKFVLEEQIDANFRAQGYTVVHPQELSVAEQLQLYANAKKLVFSEGSAIHLYVLAARPNQQVYFIWRRQVMHPIFARQLDSFGAGPLAGKNHVRAPLFHRRFPGDRARAASLIDFASLGADLAALGYVDPSQWTEPPQRQLIQAVRKWTDVFETGSALEALEET